MGDLFWLMQVSIYTIAIHTHHDEGREEGGEWIINHHAHLIPDTLQMIMLTSTAKMKKELALC